MTAPGNGGATPQPIKGWVGSAALWETWEYFSREPAIGTAFPFKADGLLIGRLAECDVVRRQGPHSDPCSVARRRARIEQDSAQVRVRDLINTEGT